MATKNTNKISRKLKAKPNKKVAILLWDDSIWSINELYQELKQKGLSSTIIIHDFNDGTSKEMRENRIKKTKDFCEQNGFNYIINNKKVNINSYDIILFLSPYETNFPKNLRLNHIKTNKLTAYIPYGFFLSKIDYLVFEMLSLHLFNYIFDIQYSIDLAKKTNKLLNYFNRVDVGYPKMDYFFDSEKPEIAVERNCILYAPHHSIFDLGQQYSTFDKNYSFFLEMAKKYKNIHWIFRPHPVLARTTIQKGVFQSYDEYLNYIEEWKNLENAEVSSKGNYFSEFDRSVCMILDSESFVAEYYYENKPIVFLRRDSQRFNSIGQELIYGTYEIEGDNYEALERFIKAIDDGSFVDDKKEIREQAFNRYLNYYEKNQKTASQSILNYLGVDYEDKKIIY
ncbi:MAG: CDP-glycerol glycerophosphotransferase family protein [Anaeroplasmataceae bacterium]|nr:CDP-glycerol glycerophosphotransferase family protein [Anaeroplasmataceae bacterium]